METPAILGGTPVRKPENKIFYGKQWINEDDIEAVVATLRSDYLTCGPQTKALEDKLCAYTGAEYATVVCNCTVALHLACVAAGVGPGDEVITTPLTFMASANCALYCGAKPVFADVNPKTYNIDPASIREKITDKTKAIVAVDFTGQSVESDEIRKICDEFGLVFIEDAAHAIGTKYKGRGVGSIADLTCFSFHPVKTVTAGEGGAILCNKKEYYDRMQLLRSHAMEHDPAKMEEEPEGPWVYEMEELGFNFRMTELQAALLSSQLDRIDDFIARRKEIAAKYTEAFKAYPELILQETIPESDTARHLYIIQLDLEKLNCTRADFFNAMSAENVQCQVHYVPTYWFPHYKRLGYEKGLCPKAEAIYKGIMSIPLYPKMSDADVDDVIHAVTKLVEYYRK